MLVGRKPGEGCHPIFVQDAQGAEVGKFGGVIGGEREGVVAVQPAMVGVTTVRGAARDDFGGSHG